MGPQSSLLRLRGNGGMTGQTVALTNSYRRKLAHKLIDCAPYGYVVSIAKPKRSGAQNDKMWTRTCSGPRSTVPARRQRRRRT
jgi:hypothetical protein